MSRFKIDENLTANRKRSGALALLPLIFTLQGCAFLSKDHYYRFNKEPSNSSISSKCAEPLEGFSEPVFVGPYQLAISQFSSPLFLGPIIPIVPFAISQSTKWIRVQFANPSQLVDSKQWKLRTEEHQDWVEGTVQHRGQSASLLFNIPETQFPEKVALKYQGPQNKDPVEIHFNKKDKWTYFFFFGQFDGPWFPPCRVESQKEKLK